MSKSETASAEAHAGDFFADFRFHVIVEFVFVLVVVRLVVLFDLRNMDRNRCDNLHDLRTFLRASVYSLGE